MDNFLPLPCGLLGGRIPHNEPIWKNPDLSDKSGIIQGLHEKISDITELLYWISPALNVFVRNSSLMHRLKMIICDYEIGNVTYCNPMLEVSDINIFHKTLQESVEQEKIIHISSKGLQGIIHHKKYRFS